MNYWPWWTGALALGSITFASALLVHRPLGVSGSWDRVLHWRRERDRERADARWADTRVLVAELAGAPGPGERPPSSSPSSSPSSAPSSAPAPSPSPETETEPAPALAGRTLPVAFELVFLLALFVGGGLAAWRSGTFRLRTDLGADYAHLVTSSPWTAAALLFGGGLLTGFGTRLAGGCSSGHGLSGCSRLHPASLVATMFFFGSAAGMSFLLWKVI